MSPRNLAFAVLLAVMMLTHPTARMGEVRAAQQRQVKIIPSRSGIPVDEKQLDRYVVRLTKHYLADFQHPKTHVLYGARLATKGNWTTPADVKAGKPHPWGYGSRIADTALHCGHMLVALLDAHESKPDPFFRDNCRKLFEALKLIGAVCPEEGLVPRGPHPDDRTAYYNDSSIDQHTTYIISLARYANSTLASEEDKVWIREKLQHIGRRLEKYDWSIKRADGRTQAHVGFSWKGMVFNHVSILLPAVHALYRGTGDAHWLEAYNRFLDERDGGRRELLKPGPHLQLNGHPIYANQGGFRLNALYRFQTDPAQKALLHDVLAQIAGMQLSRDFPGPFYKRFHSEEEWKRARASLGWDDEHLHGAEIAWRKFRPAMLDQQGGMAALAHVRFPLGGYHMVLATEDPELIAPHLPTIWDMLTQVDLEKISAAETNYLFAVVALHTYAVCHRHPELLQTPREPTSERRNDSDTDYGATLSNPLNLAIGPTIDVTVDGQHAYAIGRGRLSIFDISKSGEPKAVGFLDGLEHVRQIVVAKGIAYVASREDGLFIIDVEERSRPKQLAHYDTIEFATGVCLSGDVLFVACRQFGVELVDVSTPTRPRHVSTVRTGEAQSVVARRGFLYAGVWGTSEVVIADVRNPWEPKIVSRTPLDGFGDGLDLDGRYLYAATGHHSRETPRRNPGDAGYGRGHGLEVFDVSDPAVPKCVSRVKLPAMYDIHADMWSVTVANAHAFVADTRNGVFVLNVENPARPRFVGRWQAPRVGSDDQFGYIGGLVPVDDHVYVAGGATDLHVLAVPNVARAVVPEADKPLRIPPARPEEAGGRYRVYRTSGQVYAVDFLGDNAILACGGAGLHVVRLGAELQVVSTLETEDLATDVSVSGDLVYAAEGAGGLGVYDLSESGRLQSRGRYRVPGKTVKQVEVPQPGQYALVQIGAHRLHILDVSEASKPRRVLNDSHMGLLYGDQLMRGLIDDRYACLFWHVSGLHWYDLGGEGGPTYANENHPARIGSGNGLIVHQGQTLATVRGGYVLLDRKNLPDLGASSVYRVGHPRKHLGKPTVFGNRLYAADRQSGLVTVADISDPTEPQLIEQFVTPGNPGRVQVRNNTMIIPDGYNGLLVFDRKP